MRQRLVVEHGGAAGATGLQYGGEDGGKEDEEDEEEVQRRLEREMQEQEARERLWLAPDAAGEAAPGAPHGVGGDSAAAGGAAGGGAKAVGWVLRLDMAWVAGMGDDELLLRKAQRDLSNCLSDMTPPANPRYLLPLWLALLTVLMRGKWGGGVGGALLVLGKPSPPQEDLSSRPTAS